MGSGKKAMNRNAVDYQEATILVRLGTMFSSCPLRTLREYVLVFRSSEGVPPEPARPSMPD